MNTEFFAALDALEKEKGIPKDYMMERVEAALVSAFKKEVGGSNVRVVMDPVKADVRVYKQLEIVEVVTDPTAQICITDIQKKSRRYKIGDIYEEEMNYCKSHSIVLGKSQIQ